MPRHAVVVEPEALLGQPRKVDRLHRAQRNDDVDGAGLDLLRLVLEYHLDVGLERAPERVPRHAPDAARAQPDRAEGASLHDHAVVLGQWPQRRRLLLELVLVGARRHDLAVECRRPIPLQLLDVGSDAPPELEPLLLGHAALAALFLHARMIAEHAVRPLPPHARPHDHLENGLELLNACCLALGDCLPLQTLGEALGLHEAPARLLQ